jgi:hypothetical protein
MSQQVKKFNGQLKSVLLFVINLRKCKNIMRPLLGVLGQ